MSIVRPGGRLSPVANTSRDVADQLGEVAELQYLFEVLTHEALQAEPRLFRAVEQDVRAVVDALKAITARLEKEAQSLRSALDKATLEQAPEPNAVAFLRSWRRETRTSQEQLARRMQALGLDWRRETVAALERGARRLAIEEALALADITDTPVVDILTGAGSGGVSLPWGPLTKEALQRLLAGDRQLGGLGPVSQGWAQHEAAASERRPEPARPAVISSKRQQPTASRRARKGSR